MLPLEDVLRSFNENGKETGLWFGKSNVFLCKEFFKQGNSYYQREDSFL
jgi:hypothetical protein